MTAVQCDTLSPYSSVNLCQKFFYVLLTVHPCINLVHNLSLAYLFLVYLSTSACFGRLCAHHQEKQLCSCNTWYLLFCVDDCLVCRSICSCTPDSHPHRITSMKCRINTVVSPDDGHIVARNMSRLISILRKNCPQSWLYLQDVRNIHDIPTESSTTYSECIMLFYNVYSLSTNVAVF